MHLSGHDATNEQSYRPGRTGVKALGARRQEVARILHAQDAR